MSSAFCTFWLLSFSNILTAMLFSKWLCSCRERKLYLCMTVSGDWISLWSIKRGKYIRREWVKVKEENWEQEIKTEAGVGRSDHIIKEFMVAFPNSAFFSGAYFISFFDRLQITKISRKLKWENRNVCSVFKERLTTGKIVLY